MIRNKKLSQVRFDKAVDVPTTNRAFDNIINNLNPWIDETTSTINNMQGELNSLDARVTALENLIPRKYGSFYSSVTQTTSINTPTAVTFNGTYVSNGINISNNSHINFTKSGTYNFVNTYQISKTTGSSLKQIWTWQRLNGNDIANSTSNWHVKDSNSNFILTANLMSNITAGDYVEFYWATDDIHVQLLAEAAGVTPARPATPSIIVTIEEI